MAAAYAPMETNPIQDGDVAAGPRSALAAALSSGAAAAAAEIYAENAQLLPPATNLVIGRANIAAYWQAGIDSGMCQAAFEPVSTANNAQVAYEVGRYRFELRTVAGSPIVEIGHYVSIHERQPDGRWLRAIEVFSPSLRP